MLVIEAVWRATRGSWRGGFFGSVGCHGICRSADANSRFGGLPEKPAAGRLPDL